MKQISTSYTQKSGKLLFLGPPITLLSRKYYKGCNIYHNSSVIRQRLDFGTLADETSATVNITFAESFLERFSTLSAMAPNSGLSDDFIKRLSSPLGVSLKEILLEAILSVETSVAFAMHDIYTSDYAAIKQYQQFCDLIWESTKPKFSRLAAEVALTGVIELLQKHLPQNKIGIYSDFDTALQKLYIQAHRKRLAPSTSLIVLAAKKTGVPCETLGTQHLVLGDGILQRHLYASMTDTTSIASQKICMNKRQVNIRLSELRLPIARQMKVSSVSEAQDAAKAIGFPIVIKPVKGKKGHAVVAGIETPEPIAGAFQKAHKGGSDVLVEEFIAGHDFRLLVVGDQFVAAVKRVPPTITGDGKSTVETLIDRLNRDPYRDSFRGFPVSIDSEVTRLLQRAGVTMKDVLKKGRRLALRSAANVSTGGIPIDVTDKVHPDNREMAVRSATSVGLNIAGIDYITKDITKSYREVGGAIIEINARPGLDIHVWPKRGVSRNVALDVVRHVFPSHSNGRVPIVAVAGDKGIGMPARCLDVILRASGRSVALTLRESSYLKGKPAEMTESQQRKAPTILLRDPEVETLISTVSLRRATSRGLMLDKCSLAIIMDKMIEKKSDLFYQGLDIVSRATTHCFIVGAGNSMVLNRLKDRDSRRLILVSDYFKNPTFQLHLAQGETGVTFKWNKGKASILLLSGKDILASFDPNILVPRNSRLSEKSLTNALMYAIAAAHGLGISGPAIVNAISNFSSLIQDSYQ